MTLAAKKLAVRLGDREVLAGVDLKLGRGQVTAIVGPNGAGKSTLLACLGGLRRPQAGLATLDDVGVLSMPARRRAQRIGFLPQTPEVAWAVDARTLVGLGRTPYLGIKGLTAEDHAAVAEAMAQTDTASFADRIVNSLSGGERARVLIARALAGRPEWLLADEPLAGLDPGHQLDAFDLFRRLAHDHGCGMVVTLHDLTLALRLADRVVVLSDGRVAADGAPRDALTPDVLRTAYGVEARLTQGQGGPLLELVGRAV
jgi:iron complex transport system ATP-binding protein